MRISWLWACVLAIGCRGNTTPPVDSPPPPDAAPAAQAPAPEVAPPSIPWTLHLADNDVELRGLEPTRSGGVLIAGQFRGTLRVPGFEPRPARGESDIMVLTVSARGALEDLKTFGSEGKDVFQSLHGTLVTVRSFGLWSFGDVVINPTQDPGTHAPVPVSVLVDIAQTVRRVETVLAGSVEAWSLEDGSTLIAVLHDHPEAPVQTQLKRYRSSKLLWSMSLRDVSVTAVAESPAGLWVGTRRPRVLAVRRVELTTGAASDPLLTARPGPDNRGSLIALGQQGDAWGDTFGPPADEPNPGGRPFAATPSTFTPLLDATARVLDVDTAKGDVLVHVVDPKATHGDAPEVSAPGLYLLRDGIPSRISDARPEHARLTDTHAVVTSQCESGPCILSYPR